MKPIFEPSTSTGSILIDVAVAAGVLLVAFMPIHIIKRLIARRMEMWADARVDRIEPELLTKAISSIFWFASLMAMHVSVNMLPLTDKVLLYVGHVFTVLYVTAIISLLINMMSFAMDVYLRRRGSSLLSHRGRVLLPIITGVAWIAALAFILENFGIEISTILAGLGVAGVAVGFAAQAVLGDFFSYFSILFDRPFKIGDFVLLSNEFRGNIEHIGLKTSRLRSLDGEQIIMSNSDLTNSRVKNYRRMKRRRVLLCFGVLYSTPADKLEALPGIVKDIIDAMPLATNDRAHFKGFGESSLDFEVAYYVESPEYNDYMDTQQAVNLALVRALEAEGVEFAYPTRTLHIVPKQGGVEGH